MAIEVEAPKTAAFDGSGVSVTSALALASEALGKGELLVRKSEPGVLGGLILDIR